MAPASKIMVLERCKISPPPSSTTPTSLPLTFFDIPWLLFSPSQPLFFYQYPLSTSHFTSTTLPFLKHSLSLTLQHFSPFAGTLITPGNGKPHIDYTDGNSISLTVAESDADFYHLCENDVKDVNEFYSLAPHLQTSCLLAVQITVFKNVGICIAIAYHHVVADERTFNKFLKTWASICKFGEEESISLIKPLLPVYDRSVIIDTNGLEGVFLKEWWMQNCEHNVGLAAATVTNISLPADMSRATFVIGPTDMERIKQRIIAQCNKKNKSLPPLLSAYVLVCAFVWVCLIKTHSQVEVIKKAVNIEEPSFFGFIAGGITRLNYPVPATYFGNCVAFGRSMAVGNDLVGEDGIIVAAEAIGSTVKKLDKAVLGDAEKWIEDWKVLFGSDQLHVMASGSPKVDRYETDFGWGKAKKIEDVSIDRMRAISLIESIDMKGGIEVGLVLPKSKMDAFSSLFLESLEVLS